MLINAGVTEIVFGASYPDPLSEEMLTEAGVSRRRYEPVQDGLGQP
jgi:deoxycytidylate deaminase